MLNSKTGNLDAFDRRILDVLAGDGRITITDLSQKVGLSKTPCHVRLKRLEAEGVFDAAWTFHGYFPGRFKLTKIV